MIQAEDFVRPALRHGLDFYSGVPCSFLGAVIQQTAARTDTRYIPAASEGEAIAIASGAWLAGHGAVAMCQNSGLGNAVNPLTSLNHPFRIPVLLMVTWRGAPDIEDEPQHALMGPITPDLLDVMRIERAEFPGDAEALPAAIDAAAARMAETGLPYALIVRKGTFAGAEGGDAAAEPRWEGNRPPPSDHRTHDGLAPRMHAMERLLAVLPERAAIIATTGKTGRELFTIADRDQHLYQVGSMGCAAGMGLGVALNADRPVAVLDGDGAALMKLGTLATIGAHRPRNLIHVVLDNGTYDSTGGQPTVSPNVDFASVALDCGYPHAHRCDSLDGLEAAVEACTAEDGPHLVHMRIAPGSMKNLGRPTVPPHEVARRFKAFLTG